MKKQLLVVLSLLVVIAGAAQNFKLNSKNGISEHFTAVNENVRINFSPANANEFFGLGPNSSLMLTKTESDHLGFRHYRYVQSYKNIPVEKTMFIVHTKNGMLRGTSGTVVTEFDAAMEKQNRSVITRSKAIGIAIANVHATLYAWQDAGMERNIKQQTNNANASYYPIATRVFYNPGEILLPRELRLCYKIDVYALRPLSRAYYFVDAQTGQVIGKEDRIHFADVIGTANTAWSGTQTIHSEKTGPNSFRLRDYSRGNGVVTLHGESATRGQDYTSTSANWILTGYDKAAMDAHYGVEQTYSFYMTVFGRNSYDGNGAALYSYVNDPTYIDNAFWDGTAMNYNKRSNGDKGGVTAIDVTGA
jgi:Zn-dependent metalloprotease